MAKKPFKNRESRLVASHAFDMQTRKSLGQHFLVDAGVVAHIASEVQSAAKASEGYVVEIGPGSGALTKPLLELGLNIIAIETDKRAIDGLNATLGQSYPDNFQVIDSDILKWDAKSRLQAEVKPVCFGNLPYYITSDILLWFAKNIGVFNCGIFMMQLEVAERLAAKHRSKEYGRLSVRMQLFFEVEKLFDIPAHAFRPPPKVTSAIVRFKPKNFSFSSPKEDSYFTSFTARLFSARRKMLRSILGFEINVLTRDGKVESFWKEMKPYGIEPETRPDAINPEGILALHRYIWSKHSAGELT